MGNKIIIGKNDLESFCKNNQIEWLLSEWDSENNQLKPHEVSRSSSKHKIIWKCRKCNHSWKRSPNNRIKVFSDGKINITECPKCTKEKQTSFPEQAIYYYLLQCFSDTINGDTKTIGMELDIYIPSIKVAIEYDGYHWHNNVKKDIHKNELCKINNINIIRFRELGCPELIESDFCKIIPILPKNTEDLSQKITYLCNILGKNINVDLQNDEPLILALYQNEKYKNSLSYLYPNLTKEFHHTKNGSLSANNINKRTSKKVWWKCSVCNYEWLAAVSSRTSGSGCPACSGRVLIQGKNDLESWCKQTGNTHILDEWDYELNTKKPNEITKRTSYYAFWKCKKCGYSYNSRIANRTNGNACPICSGKKVQSGINDFKTWCILNNKDNILKEWDSQNTLLPSQVSHGSGKRILWICSVCNHHWSATLDNRKKGKGCPQCGNKKRALSNKLRTQKIKVSN